VGHSGTTGPARGYSSYGISNIRGFRYSISSGLTAQLRVSTECASFTTRAPLIISKTLNGEKKMAWTKQIRKAVFR
jgi:hypothetical protein